MAKKKEEKLKTEKKKSEIAGAGSKISTRGRIFEGKVVRKFPKRIAIEFERTVFIKKFERYAKKKTRIHARLPDEMSDKVQIGDVVRVQECRPLSKIIHFLVIEKIKSKGEKQ